MSAEPAGCAARAVHPGSLWFHLRWGFTVAFWSWPLVLGAHYGWFWFPGGWSPQVMPAVLTAVFAAWGAYSAKVRHRETLEAFAGSVRQMWPAVTVVGVVLAWSAPMAVLSRGFVQTYSDEYILETRAHLIFVPWVFMSVVALVAALMLRAARREKERSAALRARWAADPDAGAGHPVAPGEVWFAIPPLRGGDAGDMKERPCIVLEAPAGAGVRCVSCTSQADTATRRGYPALDTSRWPTEKDVTFVRVDMVDVVPLATFRKRIAVLEPEQLASIASWVRRRSSRTT